MSDHFGNIPIQLPQQPAPPAKKKKRKPKPVSPPVPPKKGRTPFAPRRLWFVLGSVVLLAGLYNALGFLGVPYYISKTLPAGFQETTGFILDPGKVSFNPYTFHFEAKDSRILTEGGPTFLSLKTLTADLAPFSLLRRDLVCNTIRIDELDINVTRELNGSYNFDQLLRRKQANNLSEIIDFSDLPFFFSLNNIAIRNSRILFSDLPAGKTHTMNDIQLDLPAFSNIPFRVDRYIHPRFSAVINGSLVELTGQAHVGDAKGPSLATNLSCDLHALDLSVYSEYLPVDLPFIFKNGKADGKLEFHFNPEAQEEDKLSVGFDLQIKDTELQSLDESIVIATPTAQLSGKLQPVAKLLVFTNISFKEPVINSFGDSFLQNINNLLKRQKKATASGTIMASPFSLATNEMTFDNGLFQHYKDQKDKKPELVWKMLQLNVKDYTTVAAQEKEGNFGSFRLSGEKEGTTALFSWQGTFSSPDNLTGSLNLVKMNFPDLLQAMGNNNKFEAQGTADLKGNLTFPFATDSASSIAYKFTDGELTVQSFKLLENKQTVLSTPLLQASNLSTTGKSINWGTISIQNGVAVFSTSKTPKLFSQFNSEKNRLQGLNLEGQLTLLPEKKTKQKILFNTVSLKADNLESPEKSKDNFTLSAQTPAGGSISCQGDIRLVPFAMTVKTDFSGLIAQDIFPIFTDSELLNSVTGALAGSGFLSLPQQSFAGEIRLAKATVLKASKPVFAWEDSVFQGVNYTSEPFHVGIALAAIEQPEYGWQIEKTDDDPVQQLASFFQKHLQESEKKSGDKSRVAISPADIQEIQITNGKIRIQDNRMKPKWLGQITDFSGSIKNIHMSAAATPSDYSFSGKLDDAPLGLQGTIDVFAKEQQGKFRFTLENYPLASFHKQLSPHTDVDTSEGVFNMTLDAIWEEGQHHNTGSLLFTGVKPVSDKADSALTLALLTGPEDTFQLDFDFKRNTPVAQTILADEILAAFATQTVRSSVSPLLLASGDFSDLISQEFAEFKPGEPMLSDSGRETLTRYSALLLSHPYVGLIVSGGVDRQQDTQAIKEQLESVEKERVEALNQKRLEEWQKRKAIYEKKIQEQPRKTGPDGKIIEVSMPPDILAGFTPIQAEPVVVKDSMLLELAQKRLNVVSQYFTTQLTLEDNRISVSSPKRMADFQSESPMRGVKIGLKAIKR